MEYLDKTPKLFYFYTLVNSITDLISFTVLLLTNRKQERMSDLLLLLYKIPVTYLFELTSVQTHFPILLQESLSLSPGPIPVGTYGPGLRI